VLPIASQQLIIQVIARAPEWIRHDLLAKDPANRQRAEEALAAMIAAALTPAENVVPIDAARS
jgi:hypothetical protein